MTEFKDRYRAMSPKALAAHLRRSEEVLPISSAADQVHRESRTKPVWYRTQKEHWLGWLREYDGPGAYNRQHWDRDARFVYNHINCAPMLLWLAEAAGVSRDLVLKARAKTCSDLRRLIPWDTVALSLQCRAALRLTQSHTARVAKPRG